MQVLLNILIGDAATVKGLLHASIILVDGGRRVAENNEQTRRHRI